MLLWQGGSQKGIDKEKPGPVQQPTYQEFLSMKRTLEEFMQKEVRLTKQIELLEERISEGEEKVTL
jgi:hypothetical protein